MSVKCENMVDQSWMAIPMSVILLFAEVTPHCEGVCWRLHVKYIVYKYLNT